MAKVNDYRSHRGDGEPPKVEVKVGDSVGFKSDHEQYGTITAIKGDTLHLFNKNGFSGDYLRYATDTVVHAGDCWVD